MDASIIDCAVEQLRACGAEFAYLHGSRASGSARADSDFDVAAYFAGPVPASFEIDVPSAIDLLILNAAPLEIAGRIALDGQLLFDDSPVDRVRWESQTREVYSDEKYRIDRSHLEFLEGQHVVDEVRVIRLLRAASGALDGLRREQVAGFDRRADAIWLPGVKYLFISAVGACIDAAQHICSSEAPTAPRDNGDAMRALGQRGILDPGTADRMRMAVVFGDVLLHEWVGVDDSIVLDRLADLSDLEGFIVQVSRWLSVPPGSP